MIAPVIFILLICALLYKNDDKYNMLVILIVLNAIMYLFQCLMHTYFENGIVFKYLSYQPNIYRWFEKPWSFITYSFLHGDNGHLVGNMLILVVYFDSLKNVCNKVMWKIYLTSVVFGVILATFIGSLYSIYFPYIETSYYVIGASVGVVGITSFALFNFPDYKIEISIFKTKVKYLSVFLIVTYILYITFHVSMIGNIAHM